MDGMRLYLRARLHQKHLGRPAYIELLQVAELWMAEKPLSAIGSRLPAGNLP